MQRKNAAASFCFTIFYLEGMVINMAKINPFEFDEFIRRKQEEERQQQQQSTQVEQDQEQKKEQQPTQMEQRQQQPKHEEQRQQQFPQEKRQQQQSQQQTQTQTRNQPQPRAQQSTLDGMSTIIYVLFLAITVILSKKIKDGSLLIVVPVALSVLALSEFPLWFALIIIGVCCCGFFGKPASEEDTINAPNIRRRFGGLFDIAGALCLLAGITRLVISFFK